MIPFKLESYNVHVLYYVPIAVLIAKEGVEPSVSAMVFIQ